MACAVKVHFADQSELLALFILPLCGHLHVLGKLPGGKGYCLSFSTNMLHSCYCFVEVSIMKVCFCQTHIYIDIF